MLAVLQRRNLALFWFGQLVSNVGKWVFWIALPFYVFERTGSALATGIMLIIKLYPKKAVLNACVVMASMLLARWRN